MALLIDKKTNRGDCFLCIMRTTGYFSVFQQEVSRHVDIFVFMLSLLQVPFMQRVISPEENPGIGTILLECNALQPFARAVQRELHLSIFSWGTLLDYADQVVVHREYYCNVKNKA